MEEKNKSTGSKNNTSVSDFFNKASSIGKKVAQGVQKGVKDLQDKAKEEQHERKLKKYNPLFPERFFNEAFKIPSLIVIVDEAVRREIDVCEGSVGWTDVGDGFEVLYLHNDVENFHDIDFVPSFECGAAYYVDVHNDKRYIKIDCIFSKAHEEKLAELENIAYCLGAKSCTVELIESKIETEKVILSVIGKSSSGEKSGMSHSSNSRSGKMTSYFEGSDSPIEPTLKWFKYDDSIKSLIKMRCTNANSIKSKTLELEGSSSVTMSHKTACSIDIALGKIKGNSKFSMEKQVNRELSSKLIFQVEF